MTNNVTETMKREQAHSRRCLRYESVHLAVAMGIAVILAAHVHAIAAPVAGLAQVTVSFETASVKENRFGARERRPVTVRLLPDGRYVASNVTVRWLILRAYDLAGFQIVDGPNWLTTDRFDVDARIPAGVDERRVPEMLRSLLTQRWGLVARKEKRELDVFRLEQDGRGLGRNIRRVSPQCESTIVARNEAATRGQLESTNTELPTPDARGQHCSSMVVSSRGRVS